jgi:hypothetical protein
LGSLVDLFDGKLFGFCDAAARFKFGRGLNGAAIEFADFYVDLPKSRLHLHDFAFQFASLAQGASNAQGGRFAKEQFGKFVLLG